MRKTPIVRHERAGKIDSEMRITIGKHPSRKSIPEKPHEAKVLKNTLLRRQEGKYMGSLRVAVGEGGTLCRRTRGCEHAY